MAVKFTLDQIAKRGLKIHGGDPGQVKTPEEGEIKREPVKKARKSKNPPKATDCRFFILLLRQELGVEAVEEHLFHPVRKWRFDLAILSHKIAIEIEGGIWIEGGGAHSHPANIIRDIEKYNAAVLHGWRLIRVVPEDLTKTKTMKMIKKLIEQNHDT